MSIKRIAFLPMALMILALSSEAWPQIDKSREVSCKGKVVNEQGDPISGAKVKLYEIDYSKTPGDLKLLEQMQTETDGTFSFKETIRADDYRYGYIIAEKEGLALGVGNWNMHDGDKEIEIDLVAPGELTGVVVDENDRPVPDARIDISTLRIGTGEDQRGLGGTLTSKLFTSNTNAAGRFTITDVPINAMAEFIVRKSGRATISTYRSTGFAGQKLNYVPGQTGIRLVQPVEAKIEAVVVEKETGKPVSGVQIAAVGTNELSAFRQEPPVSDAQGRISFGELNSNLYTLSLVRPMQKLPEWAANPVEVITESGKTKSNVTIEVTKGGILEVLMTDGISKQPVENASISLRQETGGQYLSCSSNDKGIARMRLIPGNYVLNGVYKRGFSQQRLEDVITIEDGKTRRIEHEMFAQPKVTGVVRNQEGKPVEGAKLKVCPMGREDVVTDSRGRFEAVCDPGGMPMPGGGLPVMFLVCRYEKDNLAAAIEFDEDERTVDIKLEPAATFSGKIVDPDGEGIEGAKVNLFLRVSNWGSSISRDQATTDKEGKFEIRAVPADQNYSLYARAEGYGETRTEGISTYDAAGSRKALEPILLAVADLSISGVVVDNSDTPVPGVRIYCYGDNQPHRSTQSGVGGKFTLEQVCAGRVRLSANKSGAVRMYGYVETEGGATDVKVVIRENTSSPARYVPKQPPSLVGKPVPSVEDLKIDPPTPITGGNITLLCFWDMQQRPSRHCVTQLIKNTEYFKTKNISVILVQAANIDRKDLNQWTGKSDCPFPTGMIEGDVEKARFRWGIRSLPWLILIDERNIVRANGFSVSEIETKVENLNH